ncbi:MAG: hypothetical protein JWO31_4054 [Phycisphaerales bacterium]|nr:hypothetical protein [Phycisphaerales bacterium]
MTSDQPTEGRTNFAASQATPAVELITSDNEVRVGFRLDAVSRWAEIKNAQGRVTGVAVHFADGADLRFDREDAAQFLDAWRTAYGPGRAGGSAESPRGRGDQVGPARQGEG